MAGWSVVPQPTDASAWTPVPEDTPAPSLLHQIGPVAGDVLKGIAKGAGNTISNIGDAERWGLNKVSPTLAEKLIPASGQKAFHLSTTPNSTAQKVGYGGEQVGEFLVPGLGEEAAGAKLAETVPQLGKFAAPIARMGVQAIGSGAVNKAQGGDFSTGAAAGALGSGAGEGLRIAAPSLAETAMRVRGNDRLYGRTVGDAILNDTSGVRPGTVAKTAQQTISRLTPELEQTAADAGQQGGRGSLFPARSSVQSTVDKHLANRAIDSASELDPLKGRLANDAVTGLPLADQQTPTGLLQMKRGINSDFIQNWKPDQPPGLRSSAKTAYGSLADEFHNSAPGTRELDQRISSLIPVVKRAEAVDNGAGLLQRTAGRVMAHTGAAATGIGGAYAGGHAGGIPGAIAGGAMGILAPEMLSSPTAQMIMARGLNSGVPKLVIPAIKGAALQLDRKKDDQ
jgi:hypothetical protein